MDTLSPNYFLSTARRRFGILGVFVFSLSRRRFLFNARGGAYQRKDGRPAGTHGRVRLSIKAPGSQKPNPSGRQPDGERMKKRATPRERAEKHNPVVDF